VSLAGKLEIVGIFWSHCTQCSLALAKADEALDVISRLCGLQRPKKEKNHF
jgi:hypothetical protein